MPAKLFRYFLREDIYRNSVKLFLGHASGQALIFLTGPILSRLYSPEEFGDFALLSSVAGIISIVSSGSYEVAIITIKKEKEANTVSLLSISLSLVSSFLSALILSFIFIKSQSWQESFLEAGWGLIPVFILLQGVYNTVNYSLNRKQEYGTMSSARALRAVTMIPIQILLGFKGISVGLYAGMVSGHFVGMFLQLKKIFKDYLFTLKNIKFKDLKLVLCKHYKYPLFFMPEQLINSLSAQAPVFLLTIFFGNALVGLYSLPRKLLSTPVILIGNSLGQIYFRDAALKYTSQKDLAHTTLKLFNLLFRIGVVPFSILIIFGDVIIELIFGHEWALAGTYSMLLSPWLFFLLIGSPLSNIFAVKGQQKKSLIISICMFGSRLMAFLAGSIFLNSSLAAIGLFSGVSFVFWFVIAFYSLYLVKIKIWRVFIQTISLWTIVLVLMTLIRVFIFDIS